MKFKYFELRYEIRMMHDPRSREHHLCNSENQACTGFEPLTSAILVHRSTNWANKQTGSRPEYMNFIYSLFLIYHHGFITNQLNGLLPVCLLAQLLRILLIDFDCHTLALWGKPNLWNTSWERYKQFPQEVKNVNRTLTECWYFCT